MQILEELIGKKAKVVDKPCPPSEPIVTFADVSKAKRLLGWEPKVQVEEGLRNFVDWMAHGESAVISSNAPKSIYGENSFYATSSPSTILRPLPNVKSCFARSTPISMISPSAKSPARSLCANGFSIRCWMTRFNGRAP